MNPGQNAEYDAGVLTTAEKQAIGYTLYEYPLGSIELTDAMRRLTPAVERIVSERTEALRDLVALLVQPCVSDGEEEHALIFEDGGDGYSEPWSESWSCSCYGWDGVWWVQTDPDCTGRPDHVEVALAWREHFRTCVTPPGGASNV